MRIFRIIALCLIIIVNITVTASNGAVITEISSENIPENGSQQTKISFTNNHTDDIIGLEFELLFNSEIIDVLKTGVEFQFDNHINEGWDCFYIYKQNSVIVRLVYENEYKKDDNTAFKKNEKLNVFITFGAIGKQSDKITYEIKSNDLLFTDINLMTYAGTGAYYEAYIGESSFLVLQNDSKYMLYEKSGQKYLSGVEENADIEYVISNFAGHNVKINGETSGKCATGDIVAMGKDSAVLIIWGDINRDGKVEAMDYLLCKKAVLKTYELDSVQTEAAVLGGEALTALNYLKIKKHVLRTYNLFEVR